MLSFSGPLHFHCDSLNNALFLKWPLNYLSGVPAIAIDPNDKNTGIISVSLTLYFIFFCAHVLECKNPGILRQATGFTQNANQTKFLHF